MSSRYSTIMVDAPNPYFVEKAWACSVQKCISASRKFSVYLAFLTWLKENSLGTEQCGLWDVFCESLGTGLRSIW